MEKLALPVFRFCPRCGGEMVVKPCEGFDRPVCIACGKPVYVNPYPATCQVVRNGNELLLTRRAQKPRKGLWCLPGGFIEWGEHPEDAAKRELFEETGLIAEKLRLTGVYDSITGKRRHVMLIAYEAVSWRGDPVAGDDAEALEWFPTESVPRLAFDSHHRVLRDILRGKGRG
jgi:8-oxo-dGTP diphosphatase